MSKHPNSHGKTKIGVSANYLMDELVKLRWEKREVSLIYQRILACAQNGEDFTDVATRLNPKVVKEPRWSPQVWAKRERELRASPGLDHHVSARVRERRSHLNI